jgi:hypothetical protein
MSDMKIEIMDGAVTLVTLLLEGNLHVVRRGTTWSSAIIDDTEDGVLYHVVCELDAARMIVAAAQACVDGVPGALDNLNRAFGYHKRLIGRGPLPPSAWSAFDSHSKHEE